MSVVDILACKGLGLKDCKRKYQRPTMFYMSYPYHTIIGNILGANWSLVCLSRIILLTCSLHTSFEKVFYNLLCNHETMIWLQKILKFRTKFDMILLLEIYWEQTGLRKEEKFQTLRDNLLCNHETMIRLQKILKFTTKFDIKITEKEKEEKFPDIAGHFFGMDANFDTYIGKPGLYVKTRLLTCDKQSYEISEWLREFVGHYRMTRHVRCNLVPLFQVGLN
ncbi:hypothetical protein H5410_029897 [Solanum commersonii]|uniref:Uncharacterized protein n=1 Tax=Solanum commersonii TaxID=4109 RepID=A0A9J5YFD7_SOLCO|nr:hypothetical protein H5410_029897 [Solanum commersonii]